MAEPDYLAELYLERHPREAAAVLEDLDPTAIADLAASLGEARGAALLAILSPAGAAAALAAMSDEHAANLFGLMPRRAAGTILRSWPHERRAALLQSMPAATRLQIEVILRQPMHRVGAWMDSHARTVVRGSTVERARRRLRSVHAPLNELYLVDDDLKLLGIVPVSALIGAADDEPIEALAQAPKATLRANAGIESALDNPAWDDADCLAVVDRNGRFVGSVRHAVLHRAALRRPKSEAEDAAGDYMSLANNLYVGLAEVLATSIAKDTGAGSYPPTEGEPSR